MTSTMNASTTTGLPTVAWESIGPEQATQMLAVNPNNRNLKLRAVDAYARDIADGAWVLDGNTIKVAANGSLLDGQHRLRAVVKAGQPITSLVVRGLPTGPAATTDTGAKRTFSDVLTMRGEVNCAGLAAAVRLAVMMERGALNGNNISPTVTELTAFLDAHPEFREYAKKSAGAILPISVNAVLMHLADVSASADADETAEFFRGIQTGAGLEYGDPRLTLRNQVMNIAKGRGVRQAVFLAWGIKSWNAYVEHRQLRIIKWGANEAFPTAV